MRRNARPVALMQPWRIVSRPDQADGASGAPSWPAPRFESTQTLFEFGDFQDPNVGRNQPADLSGFRRGQMSTSDCLEDCGRGGHGVGRRFDLGQGKADWTVPARRQNTNRAGRPVRGHRAASGARGSAWDESDRLRARRGDGEAGNFHVASRRSQLLPMR
jgi:hypothetical protein